MADFLRRGGPLLQQGRALHGSLWVQRRPLQSSGWGVPQTGENAMSGDAAEAGCGKAEGQRSQDGVRGPAQSDPD